MAKVNTFRDIIAWQKGITLSKAIYAATQRMPADERFGLTSQMRRAAISVPSNIAEGYARGTTKDYVKHLRISRGSLAELGTQYELAADMKMIPSSPAVWALIEEATRVLQFLIMSLERKQQADRAARKAAKKRRER
jgi:four helix bundle protein